MGVSDMRFLGVGCGSRDHWPETHLFGGDDGMVMMVIVVDTIQEPDTSVERVGSAVEAALAKCSA